MKELTAPTLLQRAITMVMTLFVLSLSVFYPVQVEVATKKVSPKEDSLSVQSTLSNAAYAAVPVLTAAPEPVTAVQAFFFAIPRLWAAIFSTSAPELKEYTIHSLQFFIQKIQFVFVSTQAP